MKKEIKIGIIGCGQIANYHADALEKLNVNIACCTDPNIKIGQEFAANHKTQHFKTLSQMLDNNELDAVIVSTPNQTHYKICNELINKQIKIFCEKPLTPQLTDSYKLKKYALKNKTFFQVGYMKRFHKSFQELKKTISKLGEVQFVNIQLLTYKTQLSIKKHPQTWQFSPKNAGGYLLPLCGSHLLDITRYLFNDINNVNSQIKYWPDKRDYSVQSLLRTTDNIPINYNLAIIHFNNLNWTKGKWEDKISIIGTKGKITLTNPSWQGNLPIKIESNINGKIKTKMINDDQWKNQMDAFLKGIKNNKVYGANIEDGYKVDKLISDIYKSDKTMPKKGF